MAIHKGEDHLLYYTGIRGTGIQEIASKKGKEGVSCKNKYSVQCRGNNNEKQFINYIKLVAAAFDFARYSPPGREPESKKSVIPRSWPKNMVRTIR